MLNTKMLKILRNLSYTITSNIFSLIVSSLVILIVPKLIGLEEYGHWQLYMFYAAYVGFMHFGWNDGIYLRYGGEKYGNLEKKVFFSQFYMLCIFQLIMGTLIIFLAYIMTVDANKLFIIQMTAVCMVIMNVRSMLLYVLQSTNRIKEYAQITLLDRLIYIILISIILLVGIRDYKIIIIIDILTKCITLLYSMFKCKEIVFRNLSIFYFDFKEVKENITIGIKLMLANISSMMIVGSVRFGIERSWSVAVFGKVSLVLSITNLMMIFINAVGTVMFPLLRRSNKSNYPRIYSVIKDFLIMISLGLLALYYPLRVIIGVWLPNYSVSLEYMALIFPLFVFEGKMSVLINTFYQALRKEKQILGINIISLLLSILITIVTTVLLKDLIFAILSIVILLAIRSILAELFLSQIIGVSILKDTIIELIVISAFVLTSWFVESWYSIILYMIVYLSYTFFKRKDFANSIKNAKFLNKGIDLEGK